MNICAPAMIYIAFSLTQVIIDTYKGMINTAVMKFIFMCIIAILLNILCMSGMSIAAWFIVFIPFIFMSVIVSILLFVFGLDPATGKIKINPDTNPPPVTYKTIVLDVHNQPPNPPPIPPPIPPPNPPPISPPIPPPNL